MKKGLVYFLLSIFLLFVYENKKGIDFSALSGLQVYHLNSLAKKQHAGQLFEKQNTSASSDLGKISPDDEDDEGATSPILISIFIGAAFFIEAFSKRLFQRKVRTFSHPIFLFGGIQRFLLIRCIRI